MRILIDLSYFDHDNTTGVANYALRLIGGFVDKGCNVCVLCNSKSITYIKAHYPTIETYPFDNFLKYNLLKYLLLYFTLTRKIRRIYNYSDADLFFLPFFTLWSIIPPKINSIAVIHDVQPFVFNSFVKNIFYRMAFNWKLMKCKRIVTISNFSKGEIAKLFPRVGNKINVIYNSIKPVLPNPIKHFNLPEYYILDVNSMEEYKNHMTLIKAFKSISHIFPHHLIIKSRNNDYWKSNILPYIIENNLSDRISLIDKNLSDEELAFLYSKASLFVSTSLMEGFGFTPIEAAIYKTPVITSNCTALKETTQGKLFCYAPPKDYKVLYDKIIEILSNPPSDEQLEKISSYFRDIYSVENQVLKFLILFRSFN